MHQHYSWGILGLILFGGIWFAITRPNVKLLEQTPNKLAFRILPTFFWGVELFFAGIGLLSFLFALTLTPVTTLTCERSTPSQLSSATIQDAPAPATCELLKFNWLGLEKSKISISGLQGATVETKIDTYSDGKMFSVYRVILFTNGSDVPFTNEYSANDDVSRQALISQINTFVENPLQASLLVQQDNRLFGVISIGISSFFVLLSILVIAVVPVVLCIFDKELNSVTIKRRRWFSEEAFQHSLREISNVQVECVANDDWVYRVTLNLESGEKIPLTWFYTSGFEEKQYIVASIKSFLNSSGSSQPLSRAE